MNYLVDASLQTKQIIIILETKSTKSPQMVLLLHCSPRPPARLVRSNRFSGSPNHCSPRPPVCPLSLRRSLRRLQNSADGRRAAEILPQRFVL